MTVRKSIKVSCVPGYTGFCTQVDSQWSTMYQKEVGSYRLVHRTWYWPFYHRTGYEFLGEEHGGVVFEPTTKHLYSAHARRTSTVNTGEALAMQRGLRLTSTIPQSYRDTHPGFQSFTPVFIPETGIQPKAPEFKSGDGGDFGGGGATGEWDSTSVQSIAGSVEPASDPSPAPDTGESCRASDYSSSSGSSSSSSFDSPSSDSSSSSSSSGD